MPKRSKPLPHTTVIIHIQTALSCTPSMDLGSPRAPMVSVSHRLCPIPLEPHTRLHSRCMIPKTYKPLQHLMGSLTCKPHYRAPAVWIYTAPYQRDAYLTHRLCTHQRDFRGDMQQGYDPENAQGTSPPHAWESLMFKPHYRSPAVRITTATWMRTSYINHALCTHLRVSSSTL